MRLLQCFRRKTYFHLGGITYSRLTKKQMMASITELQSDLRKLKKDAFWLDILDIILPAKKWAILNLGSSYSFLWGQNDEYLLPFEPEEVLTQEELAKRGYVYKKTVKDGEVWIVPGVEKKKD